MDQRGGGGLNQPRGELNRGYKEPNMNILSLVFVSYNQTWRKLQAVQAALADILSQIPLFLGLF